MSFLGTDAGSPRDGESGLGETTLRDATTSPILANATGVVGATPETLGCDDCQLGCARYHRLMR